ncbi:Protein of unknown function [Collimonas sp. OK607]|uniref:DUF2924 domain-containing protein n=1 Tax=Collimonas sp. OK607 TaxID=1798194 RepID=UPI0008E4A396|nr:DUF2924 domain-containing protein [Collimonas sp. OK607]SFB03006.1 Protein of unknown function [Collimonas sp. OK607]
MYAAIHISPTPASVTAQIAQLPELAMPEIKKLWRRLYGDETPNHNRQFLERRIAFKLQELEFKKENRALLERNKRRIDALISHGKMQKREREYQPVPGTVLRREYQGIEYQVVATADGQYEFQGRVFPSLSMVAREITGTRWSGPLFFGLRERAVPKSKIKAKAKPNRGDR